MGAAPAHNRERLELTDRLLTRGLDVANDRNYIDWWMSHAAVPEGAQITAASALGQFPFDLRPSRSI